MEGKIDTQVTRSAVKSTLRHGGWLAYLGTALSLVICYAKLISVTLLPVLGVGWNFNPHLQAVLMIAFALLSVVAIYRDRDRHQDRYPAYMAMTGLVIMVSTLYTFYDVRILFLGYFLLLIAAFANQMAIFKQLNLQIQQQAAELVDWNQMLEQRVAEQVAELDRVGHLKRFLAPEVAELIVAQDDNALLQSHRRYVAALFCDLRGFTAFSEHAEPEEVIDVLQAYHQVLGRLVLAHQGTINHSAGDGLMVIFNDPLPCDEPVRQALALAFAAHDAVKTLVQEWTKFGYQLGFGIGVAAGYATLGIIGDNRRSEYTATGNVINLASRLCDQAQDGEILINQRAYLDVEGTVKGRQVSGLELKGVSRQQEVYTITARTPVAAEI